MQADLIFEKRKSKEVFILPPPARVWTEIIFLFFLFFFTVEYLVHKLPQV